MKIIVRISFNFKLMKHLYLLPLALLLAACGSQAPDIDDLKEQSYPLVGAGAYGG